MTCGIIARNSPDHIAIICEDGRSIRYEELLADLDRFSEYLQRGQLIFIVGRNDYPTLLFYLAALEHGAVPLLFDADTQSGHVASLSGRFSPHLLLTPSEFAVGPMTLSSVTQEMGYTLYRNDLCRAPQIHDALALLLSTSGTTGAPKLVRLSQRNIVANALSIASYLQITPEDRAAASLPFSYSYGLSIVNSHLISGATLILSTRSLMEQAYWQQMRTHQATSFAGVPYHYDMLLRLGLDRLDLPSLRKMTQAGGRMAPEKTRKMHQLCQSRDIRFWTMYGQTEASPRISYLAPEDGIRKLGSIGKPVPGGKMWIRDDEGADITASGEIGELIYEGPNVFLGYAESADDFALGDVAQGVLATGDLARCDADGYFFVEGRQRRFLKIHGKRISLDQVERLLADCGQEGAAVGQDDRMVVYVVESAEGIDKDRLRRDLASLAGIHPSTLAVETIARLPRLSTGKVDYPCLASMLSPT